MSFRVVTPYRHSVAFSLLGLNQHFLRDNDPWRRKLPFSWFPLLFPLICGAYYDWSLVDICSFILLISYQGREEDIDHARDTRRRSENAALYQWLLGTVWCCNLCLWQVFMISRMFIFILIVLNLTATFSQMFRSFGFCNYFRLNYKLDLKVNNGRTVIFF